MPKEISDKLIWFFLLLPGFLSVSLVGLIVDLGQLSEFQLSFYSLTLTLVDIAIALPFYWGVVWLVRKIRPAMASTEAERYIFFAAVISVSLVVGIILGIASEQDRFFVTLRGLPITDVLNKRSSNRPIVFLLSQNTAGQLYHEGDARPKALKQTDAWARIQTKDGSEYEGWPEFYETGSKPTEIYLSPACEVKVAKDDPKQGVQPINGPGVIVYESEIRAVQLLDKCSSPCFAHWMPPCAAKPSGKQAKPNS